MSDGRRARRERNREAVLDALMELINEGDDDPSVDDIAARAGVSYRSVYRYFDDRADLFDAATKRAMEWIRPLIDSSGGSDPGNRSLDERIDELVDARVELYQQLAEITRTAMTRARSEWRIANEFLKARAQLREQIERLFMPELDSFSPAERKLRLSLIDVAFQFSSLDYFVVDRGHTMEETARALRGTIRAALLVPEVGT
jgi:AcrR family transcriptional regulator